jgi:phage-related protein
MSTALVGLNPVTVAITAVVALFAGALVELWITSQDFRDKVVNAFESVISIGRTFYETIKPFIDTIARSFTSLWEDAIKPLWAGWVKFVEGVMDIMFVLWEIIAPIVEELIKVFGGVFFDKLSKLVEVMTFLAKVILIGVAEGLGYIGEKLSWLSDKVKFFKDNWNTIWEGIGNGFANFFKPVTDFFNGFVTWFANRINDLIRVYNSLPLADLKEIKVDVGGGVVNGGVTVDKTGKSNSTYGNTVSMYADGGMPSQGEMFIARESGAELVGSIGGRSAVMNNQQIVQAVSQGVASAVSSVMSNDSGGNVILQVGEEVFGRIAIKTINKTMKNTNLVLDV